MLKSDLQIFNVKLKRNYLRYQRDLISTIREENFMVVKNGEVRIKPDKQYKSGPLTKSFKSISLTTQKFIYLPH